MKVPHACGQVLKVHLVVMECFLKRLKGKRQTRRRLSHICEQRCQCRSRTSSLLASERDLLSALRSCIDLPAVVLQRSDLSSSVYFSPPFYMLAQTQQIHTHIHSLTLCTSHTHTHSRTHTHTHTDPDRARPSDLDQSSHFNNKQGSQSKFKSNL